MVDFQCVQDSNLNALFITSLTKVDHPPWWQQIYQYALDKKKTM
jgi:hypothetical protein